MSLRIGVLGASRIAESAIVAPAQELGHRLVAVAARDPLRANAFADKHGVERVLPSYEDVVSDPAVDVVYNSLHAPWNLAAVAAGKPVLTEKPFPRNRDEAQRVATAAESAGVTVMEGFTTCSIPRPAVRSNWPTTAHSVSSPAWRPGWACRHRCPAILGGRWDSPVAR